MNMDKELEELLKIAEADKKFQELYNQLRKGKLSRAAWEKEEKASKERGEREAELLEHLLKSPHETIKALETKKDHVLIGEVLLQLSYKQPPGWKACREAFLKLWVPHIKKREKREKIPRKLITATGSEVVAIGQYLGIVEHVLFGADDTKRTFLIEEISKFARSEHPVFILGESGTGKELIAQWLHYVSEKSEKPFVAINCAAIPKELIESELFGSKKGAFTGAIDKEGILQKAGDGTLFLDEIGDMPLAMQSKLLRVLEERKFWPVGGHVPINFNARIISATNQNIDALMKEGNFREDLYYRISVLPIILDPLRNALNEMSAGSHRRFFAEVVKNLHLKHSLTDSAIRKLSAYHFPGNYRELRNVLQRADVKCGNGKIEACDISFGPTGSNRKFTGPDDLASMDWNAFKEYIEHIERQYFHAVLDKYGNKKKTCETIGYKSKESNISGSDYHNFQARLKKLGIN